MERPGAAKPIQFLRNGLKQYCSPDLQARTSCVWPGSRTTKEQMIKRKFKVDFFYAVMRKQLINS
jgi:hypothetical protein